MYTKKKVYKPDKQTGLAVNYSFWDLEQSLIHSEQMRLLLRVWERNTYSPLTNSNVSRMQG